MNSVQTLKAYAEGNVALSSQKFEMGSKGSYFSTTKAGYWTGIVSLLVAAFLITVGTVLFFL
jgi:hypothetical protein